MKRLMVSIGSDPIILSIRSFTRTMLYLLCWIRSNLTRVVGGYNLDIRPFNHELQHSYGLWVVVYIVTVG